MPTEVEKEMCAICAQKRKYVRISDGGRTVSVTCGSDRNPRCPGFVPGNLRR